MKLYTSIYFRVFKQSECDMTARFSAKMVRIKICIPFLAATHCGLSSRRLGLETLLMSRYLDECWPNSSWIPKRIQLPPQRGKETTIPKSWITRVYARTIEYKYGSKLHLGWDPHEPWKRDGRIIL